MENSTKDSVLVQSEDRSEKRIAVLSNTVARNRSFLPAICIEKVVYMKTGKDVYCKVHQSPRLPRVDMDDTIHLISKRENPPTIKANRASSTGKLVAHISQTHITKILQKITGLSTMKLVAVTLITEFKVYHTQQSKKKTIIARKS